MTHLIKYCKHCGKQYTWQGSGEGCFDQPCSETHCEECYSAIKEVLSKIPIKNVKKYVEFDRKFHWDLENVPNYEEVKEWHNKQSVPMLRMISWNTSAIAYPYKYVTLLYTKDKIYVNAMVDINTKKVIGYIK